MVVGVRCLLQYGADASLHATNRRGQTPLSRAQSRVCGSASEPSRSRVSIRRGQTPLEIDYSRLTKEGAKRLIARHGRSQPHTPIRMGDTALGA